MASVVDGSGAMTTLIDENYEFAAPRFFDFINGETEEDMRRAELWFESSLSYGPSPSMPRIKTERSIKVEALCDFNDAENEQKGSESTNLSIDVCSLESKGQCNKEVKIEEKEQKGSMEVCSSVKTSKADPATQESKSSIDQTGKVVLTKDKENSITRGGAEAQTPKQSVASQNGDEVLTGSKKHMTARKIASLIRNHTALKPKGLLQSSQAKTPKPESATSSIDQTVKVVMTSDKENSRPITGGGEAQTPKQSMASQNGDDVLTGSRKHMTARKIASLIRNPNALKPKVPLQSSQAKTLKPASSMMNLGATPNLAQENQAIKRQKLEGGKSRQILNVKPTVLPHKSKMGVVSSSSTINSKTKEERKVYVREPSTHFVSAAEMVNKFQSSTRDLPLPSANSSHRKPKLTLTRPKEPELETSQRIRSVKMKSTAELEEEMMAKIPKFKARPLNKKILEGPNLPTIQRSTPQPPEFQEFHLETMIRAHQNVDSASIASTEVSRQQNNQWKPQLTESRTPNLQTSLRARPPKVKSSLEIEQEELEKIPKFKARPLNKKVLESKGNLGLFCNTKKHLTQPEEFHFATDERFPQPTTVIDLFDKLSLNSENRHDNLLPRKTTPNPFHLHTEERGAEKEKKFMTEIMRKQLEDEKARVPKANPYPYTTDFPLIPPKPEPKHCTKPEPFQLESLIRHEVELNKEMEERRRKEKEEAQMKIFRAQPVLKEDPIPLPEKVRKPLTEVQKFNLHVESRAVDRAEFDQKVKEKELTYKRYREESEALRMIEEEKAMKQLRRTLVPLARPVPNFSHPFYPQRSSKEPTKAKSPNLRIIRRKEKGNTSAVTPPMSSAAALMR
ncbi:hypothetical protein SAY86_027811 [Trapa natans]|uniref:Protein TPX2-like n=1 Tax=Trapa natans TaxID=22666 RepID=A0AAN7RBM3_TRANT|nr:hypothetical protein SAY86_027811 [Trapa natans]